MAKFLPSPEKLGVLEKVDPEGFDLGGVGKETEKLLKSCETNWVESSGLHCIQQVSMEEPPTILALFGTLSHPAFLLRKCKPWKKQIRVLGFLDTQFGWECARATVSYLGLLGIKRRRAG